MADTEGERDTRLQDEAVSVRKGGSENQIYSLSPPIEGSNNLSLQELIEAELSARLAPLQPDSLEDGTGSSPPDSLDPCIPQHYDSLDDNIVIPQTNGVNKDTFILDTQQQITMIKGALDPLYTLKDEQALRNDILANHSSITGTAKSAAAHYITCDSLDAQNFSLDSLADAESGVDVASPNKLASAEDSTNSSPPLSPEIPSSPSPVKDPTLDLIPNSDKVSSSEQYHIGMNGFASPEFATTDDLVANTNGTSNGNDPNASSLSNVHDDIPPSSTSSLCNNRDTDFQEESPTAPVSSDLHLSNNSELLSALHVSNNVSLLMLD